MTDEQKLEAAKAQGRYVDLGLLGPEQLCVNVKIEGTDGEYETVYNTYEEVPAPAAEAPAPAEEADEDDDVVEMMPPATKWKQTQRLELSVHSSKRLLRQSTLL